MTLSEFIKADKKMEQIIWDFADQNWEKIREKNQHYNSVDVISDGVVSPEKYYNCKTKIMWILKEPYDDYCKSGSPKGGGWSLTKDYFLNCIKGKQKINQYTYPKIVYSMNGLFNDIDWVDMPNYKDTLDILENIAIVNVAKMPAYKTTSAVRLFRLYEVWKPILDKQIELYNPNVIIFGSTFNLFKSALLGSVEEKPNCRYDTCHAYYAGNKLYIDAYHPSARISSPSYVGDIIKSVVDWGKFKK